MSPSSIFSEVLATSLKLNSIHSELRTHYVINIFSHTTGAHTLITIKIVGLLLLLLQYFVTANGPGPGILAKVKRLLTYQQVRSAHIARSLLGRNSSQTRLTIKDIQKLTLRYV
jgi:hypothetical protein